jgi:hypothetical protein
MVKGKKRGPRHGRSFEETVHAEIDAAQRCPALRALYAGAEAARVRP